MEAAAAKLRAAVAAPLPTLKDWALPTKLPCSCVQCTTAQNFLSSPTDIGPKEMRGISCVYVASYAKASAASAPAAAGHLTAVLAAASAKSGSGFSAEVKTSQATRVNGRLVKSCPT